MKIDKQLYNKILDKAIEWGPELGKPLKEKARKFIENYSIEEQNEILNYIEKVQHDISAIFYDEYEKAYKNPEYIKFDFKEYIQKNYPWIDANNTQHLINQAGYYAWHEGLLPKNKNEELFENIFGSLFWGILHIFAFIYKHKWIFILLFILFYIFIMIKTISGQNS